MKKTVCALLASALLLTGCSGAPAQSATEAQEPPTASSSAPAEPEATSSTADNAAALPAQDAKPTPRKIPIAKIEASSVLPDEEGYSYSVDNLTDGNAATAWVEGVPGLGVNERLTLTLEGGAQTVQQIRMLNGYWSSEPIFSKNGYVTRARLDFSDGSSKTVELEGGWQTIVLEQPIVTDRLSLLILDAATGGVADTCISEIEVYDAPPAGNDEDGAGWKQAYYRFLYDQGKANEAGYLLEDIDDDGVPELWGCFTGIDIGIKHVLTAKNGEVVPFPAGSQANDEYFTSHSFGFSNLDPRVYSDPKTGNKYYVGKHGMTVNGTTDTTIFCYDTKQKNFYQEEKIICKTTLEPVLDAQGSEAPGAINPVEEYKNAKGDSLSKKEAEAFLTEFERDKVLLPSKLSNIKSTDILNFSGSGVSREEILRFLGMQEDAEPLYKSWREAYTDTILKLPTTDRAVTLADINADGTPELVATRSVGTTSVSEIYTYLDGAVYALGETPGFTGLVRFTDTGERGFYGSNTKGFDERTYYVMTGTVPALQKVQTTFVGYGEYKINGTPVTEAEWKAGSGLRPYEEMENNNRKSLNLDGEMTREAVAEFLA